MKPMMGGEDARTSEAHTRYKAKAKSNQVEVEKKKMMKTPKIKLKTTKTWGMERKRGTEADEIKCRVRLT